MKLGKLGQRWSEIASGWLRSWHRAPALQILLCLLTAYIYIERSHRLPHPWGVVCGFVLLLGAVGIYLLPEGRLGLSPLWRQRGYRLSVGVLLVMLFVWRIDSSDYGHRRPPTRGHEADVRSALIEHSRLLPMSDEVRMLCAAMTLGYIPHSTSSSVMRAEFAKSGAAHLLAVSGFHLGLVVLLLKRLLSLSGRWTRGRLRDSLLLAGAWGFVALTGWAIPTVRAATMLSLYLVGRMLGRGVSVTNILASSALLQLLWDPSVLASAGFVMSYMAVLSIHLFYRPIYQLPGVLHLPILRSLWGILALSLSAQVLVLPLCLYYFGSISWVFVWTTIPITLLSSLLIPLGLISYLALSLGWPCSWFGLGLEAIGQSLLYCVHLGAGMTQLQQESELSLVGLLGVWAMALGIAAWIRRDRSASAPWPS